MKKLILILLAAAAVSGCSGKQQASAAAASPAPKPNASANVVSGPVAETMNAAGYTYVRIGDRWAAVRETSVKKGDVVTIKADMVAENFESKTLGRKFDKIIFGTIAGAAPADSPAQHMTASAAAPVAVAKVEKAKGGKSIAEVWAGKSGLQDKPVVIRGTVVKFLPQIMGKNWMHIRDGSGSRASGDDDITVTTKQEAKVGDVVTVTGTVRVDKDFGAGYRYPVIIEDAKVSQ